MSTSRLDTSITDYFLALPVINGQNVQGMLVPLYGAVGVRADCWTQNGAAGTFALYTSSFDVAILPSNSAYPPQSGVVSGSIGANSTGNVGLTTGQAALYARAMWLAFLPSASGTIYVSVNVRRVSA